MDNKLSAAKNNDNEQIKLRNKWDNNRTLNKEIEGNDIG